MFLEEFIRNFTVVVLGDAFGFHRPQPSPNKSIQILELAFHISKIGRKIVDISIGDRIDTFDQIIGEVVASDRQASYRVL